MKINWIPSFNLVLKSEAGFSDDQDDKGNHLPDGRKGCTNLGVAQTTWENWIGRQSNEKEMRALTPEKVEPMYKKKFWDACRCDELPVGVDYLVFDFAVNAGVGCSAKILQTAVGTTPDGAIGPKTIDAVSSTSQLINKFSNAKIEYYKSLNNPKYERGWLNRVAEVKLNAEKMLG
jgi:lysozyme family protein